MSIRHVLISTALLASLLAAGAARSGDSGVDYYAVVVGGGDPARENRPPPSLERGMTAYLAGDFASARKEWSPLAELGQAEAQYGLGLLFEQGRGIGKDAAKAAEWYRRAAGQGYVKARFNLGVLLSTPGPLHDDAEAAKWYRMAAEQGDARAQFNLALCHIEGRGVPRDDIEAETWLHRAAGQGHAKAAIAFDLLRERALRKGM